MTESEAMALLVASGVSYAVRRQALRAAGSAMALAGDPLAFAAQLGVQGTNALRRAVQNEERILSRLCQDGVHLISYGDDGYPQRLMQTARPPHLLYVWGNADICDPFPVAVVGTRSADEYGLFHTRTISCALAQEGVCVVSGLALGVDGAAHEGALKGKGRTIAVLGSALDRFYPEENRGLMHRILAAGGSVLSEYPMGTPPTKYSFLQRNRIIAGLSLGVLVTQGPQRSGAFRTVQCALEEGREVFALPGNVDNPLSCLPHMLIADGARLVTGAKEILETLVIEPAPKNRKNDQADGADEPEKRTSTEKMPKAELKQAVPTMTVQAEKTEQERPVYTVPDGIDEAQQAVCRALLDGEKDFDDLVLQTGMASDALGALLTEMEFSDLVMPISGLLYAPGKAMCK